MSKEEIDNYIFIGIICIFIYLYFAGNGNTSSPNIYNKNNIEDNTISDYKQKLLKKIELEEIAFENLKIQYEEIENEIVELEYESAADLDLERKNNLKIRKLEIKLKRLYMKIEEKAQLIYNINEEIAGIE